MFPPRFSYKNLSLILDLKMLKSFQGFLIHSRWMSMSIKRTEQSGFNPSNWRIDVALLIYRPAIIAPPMSEIENKFAEISEKIDHQTSYKCDFELRMEKDALLLEKRQKLEAEGQDLSALDEELGVSTIELQKEWQQRVEFLKRAYNLDRQYQDEEEDKQTMRRKLNRKLMLAIKQRFSDTRIDECDPKWSIPRLGNISGDTLKQTADKCIQLVFPRLSEMPFELRTLGNAPISHYYYNYPKPVSQRLGFKGSIIFIYPVQMQFKRHFLTTPLLDEFDCQHIADYKWCTREEFDALIGSSKFKKQLCHFTVE